MAKPLVGIDLNEIEVTMVQENGKTVVERMPANLLNDNEIVSPESLSDFLKKVKKENRLSSNCALVLPENVTFFRTVDSPVISDSQLKLNLPFEFRDFVGVNSIDYNYDYIVEKIDTDKDGNPVSMHLLAAAAQKEAVDNYAKILKKAGFKLKLALPNEMCIINLMKAKANADKEYCLVGVGYDYTRVYILKGSTIRASKDIDIANKTIDTVIARNENTEPYLVASLRDNNHDGILDKEYLNEVYDSIALEIMKTINFYKYEYNDSSLDTIHFFSIGASNKTLCDNICNYVNFKKGDIQELLPDGFDDERALMNIGLIL